MTRGTQVTLKLDRLLPGRVHCVRAGRWRDNTVRQVSVSEAGDSGQSEASAGGPGAEGDTALPALHEPPHPEGAIRTAGARDTSPPSSCGDGVQVAEGGDRVPAGGVRGLPGPSSLRRLPLLRARPPSHTHASGRSTH
jgi:hypothetical protein